MPIMTQEDIKLTHHEVNVLFLFAPYPDGVEVDLQAFKSKYVKTLQALKARGYFLVKTGSGCKSHVQLTAKGFEVTETPVNTELFHHLTKEK